MLRKIRELRSMREKASEAQKENIDRNIEKENNEILIDRLGKENKEIEQRVSLKDRVKAIFIKGIVSQYFGFIRCWDSYWCYRVIQI